MVNDVKPGGVFLINCQWDEKELGEKLHAEAKRYIARNNIQLYTVNAIDLAAQIGLGKLALDRALGCRVGSGLFFK